MRRNNREEKKEYEGPQRERQKQQEEKEYRQVQEEARADTHREREKKQQHRGSVFLEAKKVLWNPSAKRKSDEELFEEVLEAYADVAQSMKEDAIDSLKELWEEGQEWEGVVEGGKQFYDALFGEADAEVNVNEERVQEEEQFRELFEEEEEEEELEEFEVVDSRVQLYKDVFRSTSMVEIAREIKKSYVVLPILVDISASMSFTGSQLKAFLEFLKERSKDYGMFFISLIFNVDLADNISQVLLPGYNIYMDMYNFGGGTQIGPRIPGVISRIYSIGFVKPKVVNDKNLSSVATIEEHVRILSKYRVVKVGMDKILKQPRYPVLTFTDGGIGFVKTQDIYWSLPQLFYLIPGTEGAFELFIENNFSNARFVTSLSELGNALRRMAK